MSIEREVQTPDGINTTLTEEDLAKIALEEEKLDFQKRAASILSRSQIQDALNVPVPEGVHLEWIPKDPMSLTEAQMKGFEFDTEYALSSALHKDGSGRNMHGDCYAMIMPKWKKEMLDEAKQQRFERVHGKKGQSKKLAEETNYLANPNEETGAITKFNDSNTQSTYVRR